MIALKLSDKFEQFKTVTSATLRTIAGEKELEPSYSAGEPPIGQTNATGSPRLPLPEHNLSVESVRLVRGCADAYALKYAHHNPKLHSNEIPADSQARAAFDALEQARVEALGMNAMNGVAGNLNAVIEEKCRRKGYSGATTRDQIPLADALHILARQELTRSNGGEAIANVQNLWGPWISEKLGVEGFAELKPILSDQKAFSKIAKKLIRELEMNVPELDEGMNDMDDSGDQNDGEPDRDNDNDDDLDDALIICSSCERPELDCIGRATSGSGLLKSSEWDLSRSFNF